MSGRGARLSKALRLRGRQKQYALAVALGVNESSISRWKENGPMSLDNAISLCRELDISLDWFLAGIGSMEQHKIKVPEERDADAQLLSVLRKVDAALTAESRERLIELIDSIL